jgi:hypothetical protein
LQKPVAFVAGASLFPCAGEADERNQREQPRWSTLEFERTGMQRNNLRSARRKPVRRPRNQLRCDSTGLKIKEEQKKRKQSLFNRQMSQRGPLFTRRIRARQAPVVPPELPG